MRHQRWIVLAFGLAALLVGVTVQAATSTGFAQFAVPDQRIGPFTSTTYLSFLVGAGTFVYLVRNAQAVAFTGEVIDELARVTWPSKDETLRATTTVVVTTLLVAGLIGVYDFMWKNLADIFLLTKG